MAIRASVMETIGLTEAAALLGMSEDACGKSMTT